jgi:hypothetical protein
MITDMAALDASPSRWESCYCWHKESGQVPSWDRTFGATLMQLAGVVEIEMFFWVCMRAPRFGWRSAKLLIQFCCGRSPADLPRLIEEISTTSGRAMMSHLLE